jgi:hypothetical protein
VVKDGWAKIGTDRWQQFVVHARDSHGNPVVDYAVSIVAEDQNGNVAELGDFEEDVHAFAADPSYRCFHVNLEEYLQKRDDLKLKIRIVASTGTDLVGYQGYGSDYKTTGLEPTIGPVDIDISEYEGENPDQPSLFCPFTTTLVEIILNRAPIPQKDTTLEIFGFLGAQGPE